MIKIGDEVMVGSRIGANPAMGVVVDIIPANDYRQAMYRVRFKSTSAELVTLTPHPNESWVDEGLILVNFGWKE